MSTAARRRPVAGDLPGAVADLGVFVPLTAALVLVNGLSAGMVLVVAGLLVIGAGLRFGMPFPVQPLKALTAVAVARELPAETIAAAGLTIGVILLLVSAGGLADRVARFFSATTVRALQCGVGVLLVISAVRLALDPPAVFSAAAPAGPSLLALQLPGFPSGGAFSAAFVLLVIPQLPLTFGNAVVAVTDVARRTFGDAAANVTPARVCRTAGVGNVAAALLGGMPMCHGSSGLTAHYRLGARTLWMNVGLGAAFVATGVAFSDQAPAVLGQLSPVVLAVLLGYAGVRHAWLVADLRGVRLALAVGAGLLGAAVGNLAVTMAVVMVVEAVAGMSRRSRGARSRVEQAPVG